MKQYITFKWEHTISGVHVSPGSAETLVRGGRKINHDLVAHSLSYNYTHTYTRLTALCLGLARWAGTRKIKPIWILLKQETVSGSGISWAICKSAHRSRQITMPAPHHSFFYRPDALPAAQPTVSKHWRHPLSYTYAKNYQNRLMDIRFIAC